MLIRYLWAVEVQGWGSGSGKGATRVGVLRCGGCDVGSCPGQVLSCSNCTQVRPTLAKHGFGLQLAVTKIHAHSLHRSFSSCQWSPGCSKTSECFPAIPSFNHKFPETKVLGSKNVIGVARSGPARDPCQVVNSESVPRPGSSLTRRTSLLCRSHFDNLLPASQLSAQISAMACLDYSDPTQCPVPRNTPADMVLPSHGTAVESLASSEIKWRLRATLAPQLRAGLSALKRSKLSADVRLPLPPIEAHFPADDI